MIRLRPVASQFRAICRRIPSDVFDHVAQRSVRRTWVALWQRQSERKVKP